MHQIPWAIPFPEKNYSHGNRTDQMLILTIVASSRKANIIFDEICRAYISTLLECCKVFRKPLKKNLRQRAQGPPFDTSQTQYSGRAVLTMLSILTK
jgi:hypothetical protein